MEGFITFLFFFVLFIWAMGKLFSLFLAWFIKRKMKKGGMNGFSAFGGPGGYAGFWSNMGQPQNAPDEGFAAKQKKQEGKVIISDIPQKEKVIDKEVGEYVDFEE